VAKLRVNVLRAKSSKPFGHIFDFATLRMRLYRGCLASTHKVGHGHLACLPRHLLQAELPKRQVKDDAYAKLEKTRFRRPGDRCTGRDDCDAERTEGWARSIPTAKCRPAWSA
jgi:hypothetical protein